MPCTRDHPTAPRPALTPRAQLAQSPGALLLPRHAGPARGKILAGTLAGDRAFGRETISKTLSLRFRLAYLLGFFLLDVDFCKIVSRKTPSKRARQNAESSAGRGTPLCECDRQ